jgi:hypothetical protein
MKCWKSAFNAQGSRSIIVDLQEGAVKIYAAKGRTGWNSVYYKSWGLPPFNANFYYIFG